MRGMAKLIVPAAIVLAVGALAVTSAQAATAKIKLSPSLSHPSASVKIKGTGFPVSTSVTIDFDAIPVATTATDVGGAFSTTFTVPASALPGAHTVTATAGATSAHKTFTVETDWAHFGFDNTNTGDNPYENVISAGNVPSTTPTWHFVTGGYVAEPAVAGGVVYFGSTDHNLYAVDAKTGAIKWSFAAGDNITTTPAVVGNIVYFGSIDNSLYAVNATTGIKLWSTPLAGHVTSSPTVAGDVVYVGSNNFQVHALDAATGRILWNANTGGNVFDSPTVVKNVVYVGSADDNLYALNATDGSVKWQKNYDGAPVDYSPAYVNGILYVADGSFVHAVRASNGGKVWTYKLHFGVAAYDPSGVAVADGRVYFGCTCGTVTALDAATGTVDWQLFYQSANQSLTVANGLLFLPEEGSTDLLGLNAATGAQVWDVTEGPPLSGFAAWLAPAVSDGNVYAGATDGNLYDFKPPAP